MISLIMKKIPAEKIFWQVFFFFAKYLRRVLEREKHRNCQKRNTGKSVWNACSEAIAIT